MRVLYKPREPIEPKLVDAIRRAEALEETIEKIELTRKEATQLWEETRSYDHYQIDNLLPGKSRSEKLKEFLAAGWCVYMFVHVEWPTS